MNSFKRYVFCFGLSLSISVSLCLSTPPLSLTHLSFNQMWFRTSHHRSWVKCLPCIFRKKPTNLNKVKLLSAIFCAIPYFVFSCPFLCHFFFFVFLLCSIYLFIFFFFRGDVHLPVDFLIKVPLQLFVHFAHSFSRHLVVVVVVVLLSSSLSGICLCICLETWFSK